MLTTLLAAVAVGAPANFFSGPSTFNYIPTSYASYPSIDASGEFIAYVVTNQSTGHTSIHVYDTVYTTDTTVSDSITWVGKPRISRDGKAVTFYGAYDQEAPNAGSGHVYPYIASSTATGTAVQAIPSGDSHTVGNSSTFGTWQAPGISNENDDSAYIVSYPDLYPIPVLGVTGTNWVCTVEAAPSEASQGTVSRLQSADGEGSSLIGTDVSADGSLVAYNWIGGGSIDQIYLGLTATSGETAYTSASTYGCFRPSMDAAGNKVAFDSGDTGPGLGCPSTMSSCVFILTVSTDTMTSPYGIQLSPTGACWSAFISSNGGCVSFNCNSFTISPLVGYAYASGISSGTFAVTAAISPPSSSFVASVESASNTTIVLGSDPCVSNNETTAFDGTISSGAEIISGVSGNNIYYVGL